LAYSKLRRIETRLIVVLPFSCEVLNHAKSRLSDPSSQVRPAAVNLSNRGNVTYSERGVVALQVEPPVAGNGVERSKLKHRQIVDNHAVVRVTADSAAPTAGEQRSQINQDPDSGVAPAETPEQSTVTTLAKTGTEQRAASNPKTMTRERNVT
jgi:hypothetical protein